ncbi:2-oxo acid dehydrogenase subunit E2, partial [Klebsiella pneumoniae]
TQSIRRFADADISVAVALPDGLITPIVRSANRKSISDISAEIHALVTRAKAGTLKPEEFQGGTFSVSNLGMLGIRQFDAII